MPINRDEGMNLPAPTRGAFGRTSEDRNKIINALSDGQFYTIAELAETTGLEEKIVKTRCDVMKRDELTVVREHEGNRVVALTDKGLERAKGSKRKKK